MNLTSALDFFVFLMLLIFLLIRSVSRFNSYNNLFTLPILLSLVAYPILCLYLQVTRYDYGDLKLYSVGLSFSPVSIYFFGYGIFKGFLTIWLLTSFLIARLKLSVYRMINIFIPNFSTLFIYCFFYSPSANLFLYFQGKDVILSIMSLAAFVFYFSGFPFFSGLSIFTSFLIRPYFLVSYIVLYFRSFLRGFSVFIRYPLLSASKLYVFVSLLLLVSFIVFISGDYLSSLVSYFLSLLDSSSSFGFDVDLMLSSSAYESSSARDLPLIPFPFSLLNFIRPFPWELELVPLPLALVAVEHYLLVFILFSKVSFSFSRNIVDNFLGLVSIALPMSFVVNVADMYRRLPSYFLLYLLFVAMNGFSWRWANTLSKGKFLDSASRII